MLFPISGVEVNPIIPFGVGLVISFFTSMGGVSGAFLLLPFQVSLLGYTAPSVSATNQVFNIVAIPSGVYRYIKEGRMLWPLTGAVVVGTLPGVFIGAWIRIAYLPDPRHFKLFVGLVLLYIGWRLLLDVLTKQKAAGRPAVISGAMALPLTVTTSSCRRVSFDFNGESFHFSPAVVYIICFLVGIAGGIYGIGGGAIVAPFFVTILGLPVYAVAGAALMGTLITSIAGTFFYHLLSHAYPNLSVAPDWLLGALFGAGGFMGMYLGARTQRFVPAGWIKGILMSCILFLSGTYTIGFFM